MSPNPPAVYPRPRGGTQLLGVGVPAVTGLSPPTRGNRTSACIHRMGSRSIPAHAGEPSVQDDAGVTSGVYPRPRGGTCLWMLRSEVAAGLSPPTRGNRRQQHSSHTGYGSIPAHAGEPTIRSSPIWSSRVYPRPRGGTVSPSRIIPSILGLSRPRGGTVDTNGLQFLLTGLSPPMRGNPLPMCRPTR